MSSYKTTDIDLSHVLNCHFVGILKQTNYFGESLQGSLAFEYDKDDLLSAKKEFSASEKVLGRYRYAYEHW